MNSVEIQVAKLDLHSGDCVYKLDHPDAPRAILLPRERVKRLQKETLF